jgi:hypothetical protein
MRFAFFLAGLTALSILAGCVSLSSGDPAPPASNTTVVVPPSHYSGCSDEPC